MRKLGIHFNKIKWKNNPDSSYLNRRHQTKADVLHGCLEEVCSQTSISFGRMMSWIS
jgi:hypothetical protein